MSKKLEAFEKVNMYHPDKVADRIAGALVDLAYTKDKNPRIAVEVLLGHGVCHIIAETSVKLSVKAVENIVSRISGIKVVDYVEVPQDVHLSDNQSDTIRCGDNGIFKGVPTSVEELSLSRFARVLEIEFPFDGKFIIDTYDDSVCDLIVCQSHFDSGDGSTDLKALKECIHKCIPYDVFHTVVNPIGDWTGGSDVDSGATNRKLGSDMGRAVTGGGLHGKDLSKADVSLNIYAHLKAQKENREVSICCAIGDEYIDDLPYAAIVEIARDYIKRQGGFEKFAEHGLI